MTWRAMRVAWHAMQGMLQQVGLPGGRRRWACPWSRLTLARLLRRTARWRRLRPSAGGT